MTVLLSTMATIFGHEVREQFGLICGSSVNTQNIFRRITGSLRHVVGTRQKRLARKALSALEKAEEDLKNQAIDIGANAVIGLLITSFQLGPKTTGAGMLVCGTAVHVIESPGSVHNIGKLPIDSLK
jgi:uncharacterized protein YbjQ (UPF0145 family)